MKTKPVTVPELREKGYRVMVFVFRLEDADVRDKDTSGWQKEDVIKHSRPVTEMRINKTPMWGYGGVTHMLVWAPERKTETGSDPDYEVQAVCSIHDQFRKKVGMAICLGRVTQMMEKARADG